MRKYLLGLFVAVLVSAGLAFGGTAAYASSGNWKAVNLSAGGCWKDQGLGNPYTVSPCATASNFFSYEDSSQWKDGSGYCPTVSAGQIVAGNCVLGVATQEINITIIGPGDYQAYLNTEYDYLHTHNLISKGSASPYYLNDNSSSGPNVWCQTITSGCTT